MDFKNLQQPLISCLCVTRNKSHLLPTAITCFESQSYSNKELIIVYEDDDMETKSLLQQIRNSSIKTFEVSSIPKLTLGALRNFSISQSSGEYFCQWDDDDWYHNMRLEIQMKAVQESGKQASILSYWLIYNTKSNESYLSFQRNWEGSILCRKSLHEKYQYTDLTLGEDIEFINGLCKGNFLSSVINASLYIYVYHNRNTWDDSHFIEMCAYSKKLTPAANKIIEAIISQRYSNDEASKLLFSPQILRELNYTDN